MIALTAVRRALHVTQQRVHLGEMQAPPRRAPSRGATVARMRSSRSASARPCSPAMLSLARSLTRSAMPRPTSMAGTSRTITAPVPKRSSTSPASASSAALLPGTRRQTDRDPPPRAPARAGGQCRGRRAPPSTFRASAAHAPHAHRRSPCRRGSGRKIGVCSCARAAPSGRSTKLSSGGASCEPRSAAGSSSR